MDTNIRKFNGSPEEAVDWMDEFECRAKANDWDDAKIKVKLPIYLNKTGREWNSMEIEGTNKTWAEIKASFMEQFLPVNYEMHLKMEFRNSKQKPDEPSANCIMSMRALLKKTDQQLLESEAVDFILHNMSPQIKFNIILFAPKTYADLKKYANAAEIALKVKIPEQSQHIQMLNTITSSPNTSRRRCSSCRKLGHIQTDCWHKLNENETEQNSSQNDQQIIMLQ